ncbi:MAG: hypothetical protein AAGC96_20070, partial [Pseudomonadota bacterium]
HCKRIALLTVCFYYVTYCLITANQLIDAPSGLVYVPTSARTIKLGYGDRWQRLRVLVAG